MKVLRTELDGKESVKIVGPFDSVSDRALEYIEEILSAGKPEVVLDLSEATYMTSQGIACIIKMLKLAQGAECVFYVSKASDDMIGLMRMARIDTYMTLI